VGSVPLIDELETPSTSNAGKAPANTQLFGRVSVNLLEPRYRTVSSKRLLGLPQMLGRLPVRLQVIHSRYDRCWNALHSAGRCPSQRFSDNDNN